MTPVESYYLKQVTAMNAKSWLRSKTILFNIVIAILTVVTSESETIRGLLSDRGYVVFAIFIAITNTVLRTVSSTAIEPIQLKKGNS